MAYDRGYKIYKPGTPNILVTTLVEGVNFQSTDTTITWNEVNSAFIVAGEQTTRLVKAFDDDNESSTSLSFTILNLVPPVVDGIPVKSDTIALSFNLVSGAASYKVSVNDGPDTTVTTNTPTVSGLTPSTQYTVKVASVNSNGDTTGYSNIVTKTTLIPLVAPTSISGTSPNYATTRWTIVGGTEDNTIFEICDDATSNVIWTTPYTQRIVNVDANYSTTYTFKARTLRTVVAYGTNYDERTGFSPSASATTGAMPVPINPAGVINYAADNVNISWVNTDTINDGYMIYVTRSTGTSFQVEITGKDTLSRTINLPDTTSATITIASLKHTTLTLTSPQSVTLTVTSLRDTAAVGGNPSGATKIQWRWKPVNGAVKYNLYNNSTGELIATVTGATEYEQTGLTSGQTIALRVHTVNSDNYESTFGRVSRLVTTLVPPPIAPDFTAVTSDPNKIKFTWTAL